MTEQQARRIVLALMEQGSFHSVAVLTEAIRCGFEVQEFPGFSCQEIVQAANDRAFISLRYHQLKSEHSFQKSASLARLEFLMSLGD